jgi:hypothetical protein
MNKDNRLTRAVVVVVEIDVAGVFLADMMYGIEIVLSGSVRALMSMNPEGPWISQI